MSSRDSTRPQPEQQRRPERSGADASSPFGDDSGLSDLIVLGGQQRNRAGMRELEQQWYGYGQGVAIGIDHGEPSLVHEYRSAPGTCGEGDPELFKSATMVGNDLYACSQTELMVFGLPGFDVKHHVSHPMLNDVHHVVPDPTTGHLWAAVSGQDLVAEFTVDGELVSAWAVDGSDASARIDPDRDYRVNTKLKPHVNHPNYLFFLPDGTLWVTRFEKRDAVQVGDVDRRIDIGNERCHDGVVDGGFVHFTTVDGHVVIADVETLKVVDRIELTGRRSDTLLGWCRGLTLTADHALIGFSRIRHTRVRGALSWVRNGLTGSEPTRLAVYDRHSWDLNAEVDLEPSGCNAVFTILVR